MKRSRPDMIVRMLLLLASVGWLAGCSDHGSNPVAPPTTPPAGGLSFKTDIKPILDRYSCTGCHGGSGGLFVTTVAQIKQGGLHGAAVVPGDGANSLIVKKISSAPPFGDRMPQGGPYLPDSLQSVIRKWIDQGASDN